MWEPGLEQPPEMKALSALNSVAAGYGAGQLGSGLAQVLASKGVPALEGLGEAGAIMPDETSLPTMASGSKEGPPHALFAYKDNFGPNGSERNIYNVFGDPKSPVFQKTGWGSSLTKDTIDQAGIPIVGKQASKTMQPFK